MLANVKRTLRKMKNMQFTGRFSVVIDVRRRMECGRVPGKGDNAQQQGDKWERETGASPLLPPVSAI